MAAPVTPSEDDLKAALLALKADNPTLGVPKIHALLLATHPEWSVSEKRTRKILQSAGLVQTSAVSAAAPGQVFPTSRLIEGLDVAKWTDKVEVRFFGKAKGKGLVARVPIAAGETIWKEDPFVLAPEWCVWYPPRLAVPLPQYLSSSLKQEFVRPTNVRRRVRILLNAVDDIPTRRPLHRARRCAALPCTVLQPIVPRAVCAHAPAALCRAQSRERAAAAFCTAERVDGAPRARAVHRARAARVPE